MRIPLYFDYASTTPVDPRVVAKMLNCFTIIDHFGNSASTTHIYGRAARAIVENARDEVASLINASAQEIIWTSGATEANNLALMGVMQFYNKKGRHLITCKTEHKSILDTCHYLETLGYEVTYLEPESTGLIDLDKLHAAIRPDTVLVSIMHVNNEIGTIQTITTIAEICRKNNLFFHVDAAQSAGKVPIDLQKSLVDLMSLSAHKIYGPKGIGALYVRNKPKVRLVPLILGGAHEQGLRSGTLATHQIAGMGEAFAIAKKEMAEESLRLTRLRDLLWQGIQAIPEVYINGTMSERVSTNLNIRVAGVDGSALLMALKDIAISNGSACTSASLEPSHVLTALGIEAPLAHSSLRITLGRYTTQEEIDFAIAHIREGISWLRSISPLG